MPLFGKVLLGAVGNGLMETSSEAAAIRERLGGGDESGDGEENGRETMTAVQGTGCRCHIIITTTMTMTTHHSDTQ